MFQIFIFFFYFRKITEQKSGENIEKTNKKDKVKSKPVTFIPVHRKPEMQVCEFAFVLYI